MTAHRALKDDPVARFMLLRVILFALPFHGAKGVQISPWRTKVISLKLLNNLTDTLCSTESLSNICPIETCPACPPKLTIFLYMRRSIERLTP